MRNPKKTQPQNSVVEQLMSIIDTMNNDETAVNNYYITEFITCPMLMLIRSDFVTIGIAKGLVAKTEDRVILIPFRQQYKQKMYTNHTTIEVYVN